MQRNRDTPVVSGDAQLADTPPSVLSPEVSDRLRGLGVAAGLVDLEDLTIRAVTEGGRRLLARPARALVGRHISEVLDPSSASGAVAAMAAMRAGAIEFYRAHGVFEGTAVSGGAIAVWVRAVELGGRKYAFVNLFAPDTDGRIDDEAITRELVLRTVAIGIADSSCRVRFASVATPNPLGLKVEDLVGSELAESARSGRLAMISAAERRPTDGLSFAFETAVTNHAGQTTTLACVVTSLAGSPDRLFMLVRPPEAPSTASRIAELERHLWRIAAEVEASGILLNIGSLPASAMALRPEVASLSPRQWEILRRLASGERVPTIARALFISPSTVRNHLSIIFDRFGVRSQPELLRLLSGPDLAPA